MDTPSDPRPVPSRRQPRKNISNSALALKLQEIQIEKLKNMNPRDIKIPRRPNRKGKVLPESLLSDKQKSYLRKRQLEIYNQLIRTQAPGRRGID